MSKLKSPFKYIWVFVLISASIALILHGVNSEKKKKHKALIKSIEKDDTNTLKRLLSDGVDVNAKNDIGWTALMYAAWEGKTNAIRALIGNGAKINEKDEVTITALMLAVAKGHTDIVRLLLSNGADVNIDNPCFLANIVLAAATGDFKSLQRFAGIIAKYHMHNKKIRSRILSSRELDEESYIKFSQWYIDGLSRQVDAGVEKKDRALSIILNSLLEKIRISKNVISIKPCTTTTLMLAAFGGHTEIVKLLLSKGVDVNAKTSSGETVLMIAAEKGHTTTVKALADKNADVNAKCNKGMTALMHASALGLTDTVKALTVKALLAKGADINVKDEEGMTTLMLAAEDDNPRIVKLLLANGADVNVKCNKGMTALMCK